MSNHAYKKGQRVTGRVVGLGPNAAFVDLPDGTCGIIRQRELSWETSIRRPDEILSREQKVEAVVIGQDHHSGCLELSLRLAQRDPWDAFAASAQRGQVVRGVVTQVMPYGAFVEIEPGIVGLVHISEIAPWRIKQVEDVLWVGDHVQAIILKIEKERRRVALSIQARIEQISPSETRTFKKIERDALTSHVPPETSARVSNGQPEYKISAVLVADDEPGLRQAIHDRMQRRGYRVETVNTGNAAVLAAGKRRFDVVFMDVHFSQGLDGVQAAQHITDTQPNAVIIFMTGVELTEDKVKAIQDYRASGPAVLLYKPLRFEEIDEILTQIESGQPSSLDLGLLVAGTPNLSWARPARERHAPVEQQLTNALQTMRHQTKATAAVFYLTSDTREVELLAQAGDMQMNFERARHNLADSPVGDVILGGELIFENDVKGPARAKFRNLLTLLNFGSCVAVPITVWDGAQHALFFFHGDAEHFSALDQERALTTAMRLGAILERSRLDERLEIFQRLALQGQLTSALAHEVNNKLSTIEMDLDGVLQDFQSLARRQPASREGWAEIYQDLQQLTQLTRQTLDTVSIFQHLMRSDQARALDVNRVVRDTVEQLRPLGRRHGVAIQLESTNEMPPCQGLTTHLHQACLNIILNAIQQINRKTATGGLITVRTFHQPGDAQPIKVSVQDDGPGIHRRNFERVFDMGYSTRSQEGTGLGLYVTRGLVEAMGGRVSVAESYMLVGTTFLVELPEAKPAEPRSG